MLSSFNFPFKAFLALFLFCFSLFYQHPLYHALVILALIGIAWWEKVHIFRLPRQGWFFAFFLLTMFCFRAIGGFGKIVMELPFGLIISEEGLLEALLFTLRAALLFFAFAIAVFSTPREELNYYYQRLNDPERDYWQPLRKASRILMYVVYLLPESLSYRKKLQQDVDQAPEKSIRARFEAVLDSIYQFVHHLLSRSEREYHQFVADSQVAENAVRPVALNRLHLLIGVSFAILHFLLFYWSA